RVMFMFLRISICLIWALFLNNSFAADSTWVDGNARFGAKCKNALDREIDIWKNCVLYGQEMEDLTRLVTLPQVMNEINSLPDSVSKSELTSGGNLDGFQVSKIGVFDALQIGLKDNIPLSVWRMRIQLYNSLSPSENFCIHVEGYPVCSGSKAFIFDSV